MTSRTELKPATAKSEVPSAWSLQCFFCALLLAISSWSPSACAWQVPETRRVPQVAESAEHEEYKLDRVSSEPITGRLHVSTQAGDVLLEEPDGTMHHVLKADIADLQPTGNQFRAMTPEQMGDHLQKLMGGGRVHFTEHFVICSLASESYTDFCGHLLERVVDQFESAFRRTGLESPQVRKGLPVMIFASSDGLQAFARQQHPEVDFSDTPGYYSVVHNQILVAANHDVPTARSRTDIARSLRKTPRAVETLVHETVHLLQYNSGLMKRFAANPVWISEGMAVYFEPSRARSSMVWSRPGELNRLLLPIFKAASETDPFVLPLETLFAGDDVFSVQQTAGTAYAESWAITWMLLRYHPEKYGQLLKSQQQLIQLQPVSKQERIRMVTEALGMTIEEIREAIRKALRRELMRN